MRSGLASTQGGTFFNTGGTNFDTQCIFTLTAGKREKSGVYYQTATVKSWSVKRKEEGLYFRK